MSTPLLMFLAVHRDYAWHHLLGVQALRRLQRLLRRRSPDQGLAERSRGRRRLHERRILPRHRRYYRVFRLRRFHVLRGLAGCLSDGAAGGRRAAAQRRQIHHGRRAGLSTEGAAGAGHGVDQHADRQHLLHDRADGRRGRAGGPAAERLRHQLPRRGDWRRHSDDHLRRVRRHAGDHVGADRQGHPADGRHGPAEHSW